MKFLIRTVACICLLFSIVGTLGWAAPINSEAKVVTLAGKSALAYIGVIQKDGIDVLLASMGPKTSKIIFNSEGGDRDSTLKLLDHANAVKIRLAFYGYCGSSCANYLFLQSDQIPEVDSATKFVFHGDARSLLREMVGGDDKFFDARALRWLLKTAQDENERLEGNIVADNILRFATVVISSGTHVADIRGEDGRMYRCHGFGKTHWSPDLLTLRRMGARFQIAVVPQIEPIKDLDTQLKDAYIGGVMDADGCRPWPNPINPH